MECASVRLWWAHEPSKAHTPTTDRQASWSAAPRPARIERMNRWLPLPTAVLVVLALAACGDSKPGYCGDRQDLRDSVDQVSAINLRDDGIGALREQLQTVRHDAQTVVAAAKSDFPDETSAISASVDRLSSAVDDSPAPPAAADIAKIGVAVASAVQSVKAFDDATSDRC
jgi:hypothetical protein